MKWLFVLVVVVPLLWGCREEDKGPNPNVLQGSWKAVAIDTVLGVDWDD